MMTLNSVNTISNAIGSRSISIPTEVLENFKNALMNNTQEDNTNLAVTLNNSSEQSNIENINGLQVQTSNEDSDEDSKNVDLTTNFTQNELEIKVSGVENSDNALTYDINMNASDLTIDDNNIGSISILASDASADKNIVKEAINNVKEAVNKVDTNRNDLGAIQNRLDHTIPKLDNVMENTSAAPESVIRDNDIATEMVEYIKKDSILTQQSQAMMDQANQSSQGVLSLLR